MTVHGNEKAEQCLPMNSHAAENGKIHGSIKECLGLGNHLDPSPYEWKHFARPRTAFYTAIGSLILNVLLIIIIIVILSGMTTLETLAPLPTCTAPVDSCPDGWVGYRSRCYYFSEAEINWTSSQIKCSSFNASLTVVDSQEEMDFLRRYKTSADYWVGLQRDLETDPWRWTNGTIFSNWFQVRGRGQCAYMNHKGIASSGCRIDQAWICSKPVNG